MLAKKTSKNQLTLPKAVAQTFPDAEYFDVSVQSGAIVLRPVTIAPAGSGLAAVREKMNKLGLAESDVAGAVAWARKKKR